MRKRKNIGNKNQRNYLDPDICFCAYSITGSLELARNLLYQKGIYNPFTQEVPSRMGVLSATKKSNMYKKYDYRRIPEIGGDLQPDTPPTEEEFAEFSKYFSEHIQEEADKVREISKLYA